jgi:hypothetical protein
MSPASFSELPTNMLTGRVEAGFETLALGGEVVLAADAFPGGHREETLEVTGEVGSGLVAEQEGESNAPNMSS